MTEERSDLQDLEVKMQERVDELGRLNSHLKAILGNMKQGLIFVQASTMVSIYNPAAEILIGLDDKKVIGQSVFRNFSDEFFGFSLKEVLVSERAPGAKIVPFKSVLGIDRVMEVETTYISEPKNNAGLLILLRDITEFHKLQIDMARAERLKTLGEVSAHVVHAIRNPLTGIRGFASLLNLEGENKKNLEYLIKGIDTLNEVLNEILDFSRPVSAKKRKIDLVRFLKEIEAQCQNDKNIEIELIYSSLECVIDVDPILLHQAIWNLINNSFDAMPQGGCLTISLTEKDQTVVIGIADTGCGIPKEELAHIFQPFFTTKPRGTGFGMTEVQKIMNAHQGQMEISSEVDKGTYISLIFYR